MPKKARIKIGKKIGPIILITSIQDKYLESTDIEKPKKRNKTIKDSSKKKIAKRERQLEKIDVKKMSQKENIDVEEINNAFKIEKTIILPRGTKIPSINNCEDLRKQMKETIEIAEGYEGPLELKFPVGSHERIVMIRMLSKNYPNLEQIKK